MHLNKDSKEIAKTSDYLLNGFKNNKKLALLIEPLNDEEYEFSKGFYNIVESSQEDWDNRKFILENIREDESIENILKLYYGEIDEITERFTYAPNGDDKNIKELELYIERFEHEGEIHSIGFMCDISEERLERMKLEEENENKNILIKEAHHRVKNNLQILSSFLNLEKRAYMNEPEMIIDHMQSRLSSLALLHEKTYNSSDYKRIKLKEYIEEQDEYLKNLIGAESGVTFNTEVEKEIELSIEILTPLLLIIDEITINSIKHAFNEKISDKAISKEIKRIDDECELLIRDNGIGIDLDKAPKDNLGWEIIQSLVKQIDGEIELLNQDRGTSYRIRFPIR